MKVYQVPEFKRPPLPEEPKVTRIILRDAPLNPKVNYYTKKKRSKPQKRFLRRLFADRRNQEKLAVEIKYHIQ